MKNWKTTVAGLATAAIYAWANAGQGLTGKQIAVSVMIAVMGVLCKDFNVMSH